ncbi:hypothetical protein ANN_13726 [Periplaneta americana]|uniref:RNA-directed DNA polymerase n=1 Tax=Periplaneta americana TaxID=6978 RepID=A0ABQ8SUB7_PERAM|nr:hypothetical protein ANN_13726 [Periplaneta americana]
MAKTKFAIKHTDSRIPPLKVGNQWYSTPEQQKVKIFSEQLYQQFQPNPSLDPDFALQIHESLTQPLQISYFGNFFTPGQVRNQIERSPKKKAPGHDLIVQPLFKNFSRKPLVLLTQIYNAFLRLTYFPRQWKHAIVVMIPKPDKDKSNPSNYRPISLLPLL